MVKAVLSRVFRCWWEFGHLETMVEGSPGAEGNMNKEANPRKPAICVEAAGVEKGNGS